MRQRVFEDHDGHDDINGIVVDGYKKQRNWQETKLNYRATEESLHYLAADKIVCSRKHVDPRWLTNMVRLCFPLSVRED